jgi:hypothetical protein
VACVRYQVARNADLCRFLLQVETTSCYMALTSPAQN